MLMLNQTAVERNITLRGGVTAPVFRVTIHPNKSGGYWA